MDDIIKCLREEAKQIISKLNDETAKIISKIRSGDTLDKVTKQIINVKQ